MCVWLCAFVHFPIRWGRAHYSFPFISNIIFYKRIIIFSTLTRYLLEIERRNNGAKKSFTELWLCLDAGWWIEWEKKWASSMDFVLFPIEAERERESKMDFYIASVVKCNENGNRTFWLTEWKDWRSVWYAAPRWWQDVLHTCTLSSTNGMSSVLLGYFFLSISYLGAA